MHGRLFRSLWLRFETRGPAGRCRVGGEGTRWAKALTMAMNALENAIYMEKISKETAKSRAISLGLDKVYDNPFASMGNRSMRNFAKIEAEQRRQRETQARSLRLMHSMQRCDSAPDVRMLSGVLSGKSSSTSSRSEEVAAPKVDWTKFRSNITAVIDGLVADCRQVLPQLREELLVRAYRFTEAVDEFRVSLAFTDRWVCYRATGLCPDDEFPEMDEDEDGAAEDELCPNVGSFGIALKACEQGHQWPLGLHLLEMCHADLQPNTVTYNTYISLCGQVRRWQDALATFQRLKKQKLRPSVVTYGALIAACGKAEEPIKALRLLSEMRSARFDPGVIAVSAAISACERGHLWQEAIRLFDELRHSEHKPDITAFNATISACEKGSRWEEALAFFQDLQDGGTQVKPVSITYNAAISACGKASQWQRALGLFSELQENLWVQPDGITFNASINACTVSAQWQQAPAP
ncbi:unnamed protein product [Effrenium voratum]|nr:unnamed protein product [Effrenium voratum]